VITRRLDHHGKEVSFMVTSTNAYQPLDEVEIVVSDNISAEEVYALLYKARMVADAVIQAPGKPVITQIELLGDGRADMAVRLYVEGMEPPAIHD
jgi:hypothetical protein